MLTPGAGHRGDLSLEHRLHDRHAPRDAPRLAGALWDHTGGSLSCTSGATAAGFAGAGGALGAQGWSVVPDPSNGTGCLTPRMAALYTQLVTRGWHPACYRHSDPVAHSDHPLGKACDAPPGS